MEMLFNIRMDKKDVNILKKLAAGFGHNVSDYVKRKLFDENEDLRTNDIRYIIPYAGKHDLLTISLLYTILYMLKKNLAIQKITEDEIKTIENEALLYAKERLEKQGYKIVKN
jgi:hypothetical protein